MSTETTTNGDASAAKTQFDDLLGGLSGDAAATTLPNGDVAVAQKEETVVVEEGGNATTTTITETRTETAQDGTTMIETKVVKETMSSEIQETEDSREPDGRLSPGIDRSSDAAEDQRKMESGTMASSKLEDNLPEYQPPKRIIKHEVKENKNASGVVIMEGLKHEGAGGGNMCIVCQKRVYELEKMIANKDIYHKTCFRCMHCNRILTLANFASLEGRLYCKPHFLEMFKTKGNYEEGFGKEKRTSAYCPQYKPVQS